MDTLKQIHSVVHINEWHFKVSAQIQKKCITILKPHLLRQHGSHFLLSKALRRKNIKTRYAIQSTQSNRQNQIHVPGRAATAAVREHKSINNILHIFIMLQNWTRHYIYCIEMALHFAQTYQRKEMPYKWNTCDAILHVIRWRYSVRL